MNDLVNGYLGRGLGSLLFGASPDEVVEYVGERPFHIESRYPGDRTAYQWRREVGLVAVFENAGGSGPRLVGLEGTNPNLKIEGLSLLHRPLDKATVQLKDQGVLFENLHDCGDGEVLAWFSKRLALDCSFEFSTKSTSPARISSLIIYKCSWDILPDDMDDRSIVWPR